MKMFELKYCVCFCVKKKKKKLIETYMETLKTGLRLCYAKLVLRTTESASPSAC